MLVKRPSITVGCITGIHAGQATVPGPFVLPAAKPPLEATADLHQPRPLDIERDQEKGNEGAEAGIASEKSAIFYGRI